MCDRWYFSFLICVSSDPGEISEKRWIPPKMCKSDVCLEKVQYSLSFVQARRCDAARTWERRNTGLPRDFVNSTKIILFWVCVRFRTTLFSVLIREVFCRRQRTDRESVFFFFFLKCSVLKDFVGSDFLWIKVRSRRKLQNYFVDLCR